MATLDYALLAEYARVDAGGLLTVVGASFDRVTAVGPNAGQQLFVVARVLLEAGEGAADIEVNVQPPSSGFTIGFSGQAEAAPGALPLDGRVGVLATFGLMVPLPEAGRYVVTLTLGDQPARELPFLVDYASPVST